MARNLFRYLRAVPARFALRAVFDDISENSRLLARAPRGSDAWLALRESRRRLDADAVRLSIKVAALGIPRERCVMGRPEMLALSSVAGSILFAALWVGMALS